MSLKSKETIITPAKSKSKIGTESLGGEKGRDAHLSTAGSNDSIKSRTVKQRQQELLGRKSIATVVFLGKNQSVAERLGNHVIRPQTGRHSSQDSEDGRKRRAKEKKKQECKDFCCNKADKTCLAKNWCDWVGVLAFLIIFWSILFFLVLLFFQLWAVAAGGGPKKGDFETEHPKLVDNTIVKANIDKGYSGETPIVFPFNYGNNLYMPGLEPITFGVWSDEKKYKDKNKRKAYDAYIDRFADISGFDFKSGENGSADVYWEHDYREAYKDYFIEHYVTPENHTDRCPTYPDQFRPYDNHDDWYKAGCVWPNFPNTTGDSMDPYYCKGTTNATNGTNDETDGFNGTDCLPYIYFVFNNVYGWIPYKTSEDDKVGVFCKMDLDDRRNEIENYKAEDFEGETVDDEEWGGIHTSRFPYLGQETHVMPIIRYRVTKMPGMEGKKADFVLLCRLDYPGFHQQNEVDAPYNVRLYKKFWTHMRVRVNEATRKVEITATLEIVCLAIIGALSRFQR